MAITPSTACSAKVGWGFRSEISPQFGAALMLALANDPAMRPQSAGEYVRMLAAAAGA